MAHFDAVVLGLIAVAFEEASTEDKLENNRLALHLNSQFSLLLLHIISSNFERQFFNSLQRCSDSSNFPVQLTFLLNTVAKNLQSFQVLGVLIKLLVAVQFDAAVAQLPNAFVDSEVTGLFEIVEQGDGVEVGGGVVDNDYWCYLEGAANS